ncbi:MAG: hypothetical protein IKM49_00810, partial [Ruminococcus sp.]|nr:hypothetical protein [Ruminococcus sp.]
MSKSRLAFITILLTIISIVLMAPSVCADCGPKPSVDLIIENPPEGEYYVDLLQTYNDGDYIDEKNFEDYGLN